MRFQPRLRTLFLALSSITFLLSWAGLVVLRFYDNQLVRQTESELIGEAGFVAALYRSALRAEGAPADYGRQVNGATSVPPAAPPAPASVPVPVPAPAAETAGGGEPLPSPLGPRPKLDLGSEEVRAPAEAARAAAVASDPIATAAGLRVSPVLVDAKPIALSGARVVDLRGIVVASSGGELAQSLAHREEVRRSLAGEFVSLIRRRTSDAPRPAYQSASRETGLRVFVALPVMGGGRLLGAVVLSRTPMTLGKAFYQDRYTLLVTALVLLSGISIVALLAAAFIARPVRALIAQTRAIADGAQGVAAIPRPATREIAELSEAFAQMAALLEQRAQYIRAFAASVSHEFKTPLTSIRGTVELLREHLGTMDAEQRARFLDNLDADAARLGHLVQRLLDLARADVLRPTRERIAVGPALEAIAARARAEGRDVTVRASAAAGEVAMAPATLEAVIGNLLDNAFQHGGPGVRVTLEARAAARPAALEIVVRDDGVGISLANAARVFDPFFTTARDRGGTGLGLTIVRALLRAHDATIALGAGTPGTELVIEVPRP